MARTFSLEAVLRLRQHKEEAEERALASLQSQRQQIEATLARVHHELRQWADGRTREIGHVGTGTAQHSSYARRQLLREAQAQLEEQLKILDARRREQQAVYLTARSARQMLTELKQQHSAAYDAELQRREQHRLEDNFLGRWFR